MPLIDDVRPPATDLERSRDGLLLEGIRDSEPGRLLTRSDIARLIAATANALDGTACGEPEPWMNPATGAHGTVAAYERTRTAGGPIERDFDQIVVAGRMTRRACGTAYLGADGVWTLKR